MAQIWAEHLLGISQRGSDESCWSLGLHPLGAWCFSHGREEVVEPIVSTAIPPGPMGTRSNHCFPWKPSTIHLSASAAILSLSQPDFLNYYISLFACCVCVLKVHACHGICVWTSKDRQLAKCDPFLYHLGTRVVRLDSKCIYVQLDVKMRLCWLSSTPA